MTEQQFANKEFISKTSAKTVSLFEDLFQSLPTQADIKRITKERYAFDNTGSTSEVRIRIPKSSGRFMLLSTLGVVFRVRVNTTLGAADRNLYLLPYRLFNRVEIRINDKDVYSLYDNSFFISHFVVKELTYERDKRLFTSAEEMIFDPNSSSEIQNYYPFNRITAGTADYYFEFMFKPTLGMFSDIDKFLIDNVTFEIVFYLRDITTNLGRYFIETDTTGSNLHNDIVINSLTIEDSYIDIDFLHPEENFLNWVYKGLEKSYIPYDGLLVHSIKNDYAGNAEINFVDAYVGRMPTFCIVYAVLQSDDDSVNNNNIKYVYGLFINNLQLVINGEVYPSYAINIPALGDRRGAIRVAKLIEEAFPNYSTPIPELIRQQTNANLYYVFNLAKSPYYELFDNVRIDVRGTNLSGNGIRVYAMFLTRHQVQINNNRVVTLV